MESGSEDAGLNFVWMLRRYDDYDGWHGDWNTIASCSTLRVAKKMACALIRKDIEREDWKPTSKPCKLVDKYTIDRWTLDTEHDIHSAESHKITIGEVERHHPEVRSKLDEWESLERQHEELEVKRKEKQDIANALAKRMQSKRAARQRLDAEVLSGKLSKVEYRSAVNRLDIEYGY